MDGYLGLVEKFVEMKSLVDNQKEINNKIEEISKQIITLPEFPKDIESWTTSLSKIDSNSFKLSDFKKMFKFSKQYNELVDQKEKNRLKIRELVVDNLIIKIKNILDK